MLLVAASVIAGLLTAATWQRVLGWLVDHGVLVTAAESPLLALPASRGIGLDTPRVAIAAAVVIFTVVCTVTAVRHRASREDRR